MIPRVVIVDDNEDFRLMVRDHLTSSNLGIEIFDAASGEMGVAKASFVKADIVLMDISLPQNNGLKSAQFIKEENPKCQIIILTMFDVELFKKAAKGINIDEFISKGEVYDRLVPTLKRCLKQTEIDYVSSKK